MLSDWFNGKKRLDHSGEESSGGSDSVDACHVEHELERNEGAV